ncbi:hypothetical protein HOY80DRAFT_985003 [Tuber brumale]|nr:hypothetical protein HOY80DRAFT_985003 [Tuber brumale]
MVTNKHIEMSTKTETPSTITKMLVIILFGIIMLLMINIITTSMIGYLTALLPQWVVPELLTSYLIYIPLWFSIIITYSSYVKPHYNIFVELFESVSASFAMEEFTYESSALGEKEASEIGGLPGSFPRMESETGIPGTSANDTDCSLPAGALAAPTSLPVMKEEAPTSSKEPLPSSSNTLSEETRKKYHSFEPKERLFRGKFPHGGNGIDGTSAGEALAYRESLTFPRPLRWHFGGKYLDGSLVHGQPSPDDDQAMQEASPLDSKYISNAMDRWGTTQEPANKEGMIVVVCTSWSDDQKASLYDEDDLDGVSEEDVIRITNFWAAELLEVCERKLAPVVP